MKSSLFVLTFALLLGAACESSGGDSPGATGGAPSGGTSGGSSGGASSGGASSDGSGGESPGPGSGGSTSGSGGSGSGSGGTTSATGGAGGAPGENDPSCPDELPEEEATCFVYPNIVCSYEDAPALGENCICAALKWDCTGCPAEPIQGELNCSGYEGEICGGCVCSEASPNWDCDPGPQ